MSQWPSTGAHRVLSALLRIGWSIKRHDRKEDLICLLVLQTYRFNTKRFINDVINTAPDQKARAFWQVSSSVRPNAND